MSFAQRHACISQGRRAARWVALIAVLMAAAAERTRGAEAVAELRAPPGFRVERFADDDFAHDIFTLTFDAQGRAVVAGPGYVRILLDDDHDGRADRAHQFADGPKSGAQGMYFDGADLYCVGDGGVLLYRDADGDDVADGPAERLFTIRSGGEHHAHALRRGPDGWWYLLVGNDAGVTAEHAQGASLVRNPEAGALLRFPPDFSTSEVYADGYRNAYDFDFHAAGDIFVWDSDDERDVSLPWYRPTRVFHTLPGSNAGWLSRSWKHPDYFCDMPPVVAQFGRGSPTGVAMYRHEQFPEPYRSALFVADWTFGRVMALPLREATGGATWTTEPLEFLRGVGTFGFAPTDLDVSPDGDLYISVGGRGTRGGVYRVRWEGQPAEVAEQEPKEVPPGTPRSENDRVLLHRCLSLAQPLSSWARARWLADAKHLSYESFQTAVLDESLPLAYRLRAVEILTELHGGLSAETHAQLQSAPAALRARAAWSIGRATAGPHTLGLLATYAKMSEPFVVRSALESLLSVTATARWLPHGDMFPLVDAQSAPAVRHLAAQLPRMDQALRFTPSMARGITAELTRLRREVTRPQAANSSVFFAATGLWEDAASTEQKLEILRIMQLALGDVGPGHGQAAVYDGYASRRGIGAETTAAAVPILESWFPSGSEQLDYEIARVASMLGIHSQPVLADLVSKLTETSSPVDDVHYLIAASRVGGTLDNDLRKRVAMALTALEPKIAECDMQQDRNWEPRVTELYVAWQQRDAQLPAALLDSPHFGYPGHLLFVSTMSPSERRQAVHLIAARLARTPTETLPSDVARLLLESGEPEHEALVRARAQDGDARSALIRFAAKQANPADRGLLVEGLRAWQADVVQACLEGLGRMPPAADEDEILALVQVLRTWGRDANQERMARQAMQLLERAAGLPGGDAVEAVTPEEASPAEALPYWTAWARERYPAAAQRMPWLSAEASTLRANLESVPWEQGEAARGRQLFTRKSCAACHQGPASLGPDLAGAAQRFSRDDLFTAIFEPDRDVSPRYAATVLETRDGRVYQGAVIYDSVDGVTLLTGQQETVRIEAPELAARRTAPRSLMPTGLLAEASAQDLADLYAYLQTLQAR